MGQSSAHKPKIIRKRRAFGLSFILKWGRGGTNLILILKNKMIMLSYDSLTILQHSKFCSVHQPSLAGFAPGSREWLVHSYQGTGRGWWRLREKLALGVNVPTVGGRQREGGLFCGFGIWLPLILPQATSCANGSLSTEDSGFFTCLIEEAKGQTAKQTAQPERNTPGLWSWGAGSWWVAPQV